MLIIAKDPENESRRFVIQAKNNLEKDILHLAYRIESSNKTPIINWEDNYVSVNINEIFSKNSINKKSEITDAKAWLTETLRSDKIESKQLLQMAYIVGFSDKTLRRAKADIGVIVKHYGYGKDSKWYWELPKVVNNSIDGHL